MLAKLCPVRICTNAASGSFSHCLAVAKVRTPFETINSARSHAVSATCEPSKIEQVRQLGRQNQELDNEYYIRILQLHYKCTQQMSLTVAELARAVGKNESYVRQHIHRQHLTARREGRNVFVELDEATRWARERGLPFSTPAEVSTTLGDMKDRAARMAVLSWDEPGAQPRNLFTLIRHRRRDSLGPWAGKASERWSSEDLGHGLGIHIFDAPLALCRALIDHIVNVDRLEIDGVEVEYALHPIPRRHRAYRDDRPSSDASVRSPFSRYSAEIIEYWSFEADLRDRWLEVLEPLPGGSLRRLTGLGFPLDQRVDRIGNLMIAGAEDAIACDISARHDRTLRFHVEADDLPPEAYRATVWGSHSGDEVVRREVAVDHGETVFNLASEVDHVGFAICRTGDGQCVDLMEANLIMEISGGLEVASGPTLHMQDRRRRLSHKVTPAGSTTMINVRFDDESAQIDKVIRRLWLEQRLHERETKARREGHIVRFQPDEFEQAAEHMIHLARRESHRTEAVYLADPYFSPYLRESTGANSELVQLYLELFAATNGRSLRILCVQKKQADTRPWWANYPKALTNHVSVRAFFKHDGNNPDERRRGFHDRYLITPEQEIIITNSVNGWHEHGVTFIGQRHGVYRAEADKLWALSLQSDMEPLWVEEIS